MTTGESIDNVDMENVTITSDAAFEKVSSDEHFEDERGEGFLKQNTSGLVQEVPNISFLDIADTMLESQKTLYDRENWVLRVGKAGRSIEAQPQDTITLSMNAAYDVQSGTHFVEFDKSESSLHYTVCMPEQSGSLYRIKILQTGYYIISYGWEVFTNSATELRMSVDKNDDLHHIIMDRHKDTSGLPEVMSGGKYIPNVYLNEGDIIMMYIHSDDTIKIYDTTYLCIQFQQYNLG